MPTLRTVIGRVRVKRPAGAVPIAPAGGIAFGGLIALAVLAMPIGILEGMAVDSGVAAFVTAAQPPLGTTARLAAAFFAGLASGGVVWFALTLLVGNRNFALKRRSADGVPVLRRADAHPDAPARRPLFAGRDLGTPFLEIRAEPKPVVEERDLPLDLDTPMATYLSPFDPPLPVAAPQPDPEPLPILRDAEPVAPAPIATFDPADEIITPPAPEPRFAPHERIETFVMPPAGADPAAPLPQATIHDLLDRLERGVARRQPAPAPAPVAEPEPVREPSLDDTLDALRALARRVG